MKPIIDDEKLLKKEIEKLEELLISMGGNYLLFISKIVDYNKLYKEVQEKVLPVLNSAKLDYETTYSNKVNWRLDREGFKKER